MNERIINLDETTDTDEKFVVVDEEGATELKKVNLKSVKNECKADAAVTSATIADASGLSEPVELTPAEFEYVPDETTNFLKTADFAAASLAANLKNADILLDRMVAKAVGRDVEDITITANTITVEQTGTYNLTGAAADIEQMTVTAGEFYRVTLINDTGSEVVIKSGNNIEYAYDVVIPVNGIVEIAVNNGDVYPVEPLQDRQGLQRKSYVDVVNSVTSNQVFDASGSFSLADAAELTLNFDGDFYILDVGIFYGPPSGFKRAAFTGLIGSELEMNFGDDIFSPTDTAGKMCVIAEDPADEITFKNRTGQGVTVIFKITFTEILI